MSIIDILLSLIIWIIHNLILPILPVDLPIFSVYDLHEILNGTMKHNFIWGLAGLNQFVNLELTFKLVLFIISAEIVFWGIKAVMFLWKAIRG